MTTYTVPRRYYTPRAKLRHVARRLARSPLVADVRSHLPVIPEVIGALALVYLGILLLRGAYVAAEILGVTR